MLKNYSDIQSENEWLRGRLKEARKQKEASESMNYIFLSLFSISALLLTLTWGGVIVI